MRDVLYRVFKYTVSIWLSIVAKYTLTGKANIPLHHQRLIVVSNHLSNFDPPILVSLFKNRHTVFLAKAEMFYIWVVRIFFNWIDVFPVNRERPDKRSIKWAMDKINSGAILILFPEGTRSRDNGLAQGMSGPIWLAAKTNTPLLPISISGSDKFPWLCNVVSKGSKVEVHIGEPFRLKQSQSNGKLERTYMRKAVAEMMHRISVLHPVDGPVDGNKQHKEHVNEYSVTETISPTHANEQSSRP